MPLLNGETVASKQLSMMKSSIVIGETRYDLPVQELVTSDRDYVAHVQGTPELLLPVAMAFQKHGEGEFAMESDTHVLSGAARLREYQIEGLSARHVTVSMRIDIMGFAGWREKTVRERVGALRREHGAQ